MRILALILLCLASFHLSAEEPSEKVDYQVQIAELDKSIEMLKRWKNQYLKKEKSFQAHNRRVLFRNETTHDGKVAKNEALEAKENAKEIQEQIDLLIARRDCLKASK